MRGLAGTNGAASTPAGSKFETSRVLRVVGRSPELVLHAFKWSVPWSIGTRRPVATSTSTSRCTSFVRARTKITSEPSCTEIFGRISAGAHAAGLDLPARSHELVARLDGWPDKQRTIDVVAQRDNAAHFVFANGSVKITSAPGGATVMANGKDLGQTPLVIEEVNPGDVTHNLRLSGYKQGSVSRKVEPQQQTFLAARLEKTVGPAPRQPFTNSLGMKFVPLADVQIAIWETRVQDYEAFFRATGRRCEPPNFHQTATDPAVKVSWFDAVAFCKMADREKTKRKSN